MSLDASDLDNFLRIFQRLRPHEPSLRRGAMEVYGRTRLFRGEAGGDHLVFIDFEDRFDLDRRLRLAREEGRDAVVAGLESCRDRIGILVADVSGHAVTDALVSAMLHQAFLTGVQYELAISGSVTTRLFEILNTRFHASVSIEKYVSLAYGEVTPSGSFRFILAGHPRPLIFSARYRRFVKISDERLVGFYPLGMFPSEGDLDAARARPPLVEKRPYEVNEVDLLGRGDVLILATDGLLEHQRGDEDYVPTHLEKVLADTVDGSAQEIFDAVLADAIAFAEPQDDLTLVVATRR